MSIKMSIPKRTIRIATALALVAVMSVVAVSLLMTGAGGATAFNTDASAAPARNIPAQYTAQCSNGIVFSDPENNPGLVADCATLLAAKDTLRGNLNWSADIAMNDWRRGGWGSGWDGVTIANNRVSELELDEHGLNGSIPAELGNLANLRILELNGGFLNGLTGEIPAELGNLANLTTLDLSDNDLTGEIPAELGNLTNLTTLNLWGNTFLTGCVPASLRALLGSRGIFIAPGIRLPYCDATTDATSTPTATSAPRTTATPTPTATSVPSAPPTPVATPTPTPTSAASNAVMNRLTALETQVAEIPVLRQQIAAMATRIARLEGGSAIAPPTPTHTPTATPIIITGATPSPTPTSVAGATPSPTATRVAGTSGGNACVTRLAGSASVTGSWSGACLSANSPPNDETYYSRFYTFTLDAAARVTITLSSATAAPYLYLLDGAGTDGAVRLSNGDVATSVAITANLPPGAYTIEASTWYSETYGDFTLELEIR